MIHIAEAGEAKGRVVVHLCSSVAHPVALDAAVWLARAFQSEIEGLYVENQQLIEFASYPFACEISLTGRAKRSIGCEDIEREFRFASAAFHAAVAERARVAEVPVRPRIVRDDPVSALSAACAACGPWNAVALAEPFTSPSCPSLKALFDSVLDATGLLIVGPRASRMSGPIVIALEEAELLGAMLAAAERLTMVNEAEIAVCLIGGDEGAAIELDSAARLVLADRPGVRIAAACATYGAEAAAAESLRRLSPGLVIARFGGVLVPEDSDLGPLAASLESPLLLLR